MACKALFEGLLFDEEAKSVQTTFIGADCFYVIDDAGFHRHIESEKVDRAVLAMLQSMIEGHEDLIAEGTMKMLGQEDIFTRAAIEQSLKNTGDQVDELLKQGLPDDARTYLGMMGFRVVVNHRGEVVEIVQPGMEPDDL